VGAERDQSPRLTRRGALVVAGVAASTTVMPGWAAGATSAPAPRLDPRRATTYRRLVRTLHHAPDGRFRHRPADAATRAFARWYAEQDEPTRRHADAVLDALRARLLARGAVLDAPPQAARAPAADHAPLVAAAVGLAAIACEPPPAEDERPTLPTLWPAA
jgi:hypothetical protein